MNDVPDDEYALSVLRRAYPDGIPDDEYLPLLAALHKEMSFRAIGKLVGAYLGRDYVGIYWDAQGAASVVDPADRLSRHDIDRVWVKLLDNGWMPGYELPRYEQPGFAERAVAALRRAYPDGLSDDEYHLLLAVLDPGICDYGPIAYIVSDAFPDRHPYRVWDDTRVFHGAGKVSDIPQAAVEQAWQHLLSHGFPAPEETHEPES